MLPARPGMQQHLSCSAGVPRACWLPELSRGSCTHDAAPALGLPQPCPLVPFLFVPRVHLLVHPCSCCTCPSLSGKLCPGQGPCPVLCAGLAPVPSHCPAPPRSLEQGLRLHLSLASLAMRGNSQFPRELLSPGQPCSPNIYISHYCLHTSLFSGGVSSFPLRPQCSPCSISSGAAIPNAALRSHYCLINLQGKAKLSSGSNPSHRAWQLRGRRDSPGRRRPVAVGKGQGRTYFAA